MKVVFDATELTPDSVKSVGIYHYAVGLLLEMVKQLRPGDELVVACNGDNRSDFQRALPSEGVTLTCLQRRMPGHFWRQWWMRLGCALFVRQTRADVYLSPKGFVPRNLAWPSHVARVTVLHDLIPFWYFRSLPKHHGWLETRLVSSAFRHTFRHADHLIAISRETKAALCQEGVSPQRTTVVLNGVGLGEGTARRDDLPPDVPERFLFAMASRLPHKNLSGVLEAYAHYRMQAGAAALPLVLCGASDVKQDGVVALGRIAKPVLDALYAHADLFVFLSLVEGFGYPPIEALRMGTPVICSDLGSLREVAGNLATHVRPSAAERAGRLMHAACAQPWTSVQRMQLQASALQRIHEHLSWSRCASGVWRVLRQFGPGAHRQAMGRNT